MSALMERIAAEVEREPERVVPVLRALLGEDVEVSDRLRPVAATVRVQRRRSALAAFQAGALSTRQVRELLGVSMVQAVHQMRARGRLLARTIGNHTLWPAWQFTSDGVREDLARILAAIARFTGDAVAADRVMRQPRDELAGRSVEEALDDAASENTAWRILERLGGGF